MIESHRWRWPHFHRSEHRRLDLDYAINLNLHKILICVYIEFTDVQILRSYMESGFSSKKSTPIKIKNSLFSKTWFKIDSNI